MKVRRVVTGHTLSGKATVASDAKVDAITVAMAPGMEFHRIWGADSAPTFPDDGAVRSCPAYFPPVGGFRFGLFTVPPEGAPPAAADIDPAVVEAAVKEMEEKLPGMVTCMEFDHPGMHTTNTVDFEYIISGEVWLELDDGREVHLRPGDTVVQNGTRHAWRNRGTEPCRMVTVIVGAHRR